MQRYAAWLVSQEVPYLPSRDRKNRLFQYGSPAVFDILREAGISYQNDRHPENPALQQVSLPEGVKFVKHPSDRHCALLLRSDNEQIAHVYFNSKLGNWILHTPHSGCSPLNTNETELHEALEELADTVEEIGDAVARGARKVAGKIGRFVREL